MQNAYIMKAQLIYEDLKSRIFSNVVQLSNFRPGRWMLFFLPPTGLHIADISYKHLLSYKIQAYKPCIEILRVRLKLSGINTKQNCLLNKLTNLLLMII